MNYNVRNNHIQTLKLKGQHPEEEHSRCNEAASDVPKVRLPTHAIGL